MKPPESLPVYIVAGGHSRRYGCDKARVLLDGVPLISRVAEAMNPLASSVTVVAAGAGLYQDLGLNTIPDRRPGAGPMGGLEAALADRVDRFGEGWLLLSACDLAEPDAAMAGPLLNQIGRGVQVVAYRGERWEPLFALYHSSARDLVSRHLENEQLAMWRMVEEAEHVAVPLPAGMTGITQLNTPEDHRRHEARRH